jgi:squalene synthase HpnC
MSSPREASGKRSPSKRAGQKIVLQDLDRYGPSLTAAVPLEVAREYCRNLALRHYENFSIASFLVPGSLRQDFFHVYAYCRWSDDLADEVDSPERSTQLLQWWRSELRLCFRGEARHPVFVALQDSRSRHALKPEPFEHLLDAFEQDQTVNRYPDDAALLAYCKGSANPVGRILLTLANVDSEESRNLSDRICTGLQIANFCQDMQRDAEMNRIYLPQERWLRHGLSECDILSPQPDDRLKSALQELVLTARSHLMSGLPLTRQVPRWLARDIQLFARGGLTILRNIELAGCDVWSKPIEVTKSQKLALLFQAILRPRSLL